jgi:hypothetical protein
MNKKLLMSIVLITGITSAANAGVVSDISLNNNSSAIVKVAEGCGRGFWRGPNGNCHPFSNNHACPRGYHLGPHHKRCWPN